jgi:predicted  nucleic acid-binding Zn-ribbon protein
MKLSTWVEWRTDGEHGQHVVNTEEYPPKELRLDQVRVEKELEDIEEKIADLHEELDEIYEKGMEASEDQREILAEQANDIEIELEQQQAKHCATNKRLGVLRTIEFIRERLDERDQTAAEFIQEADSPELYDDLQSVLAGLRLESEAIVEVMDVLDLPTTDAGSSVDYGELVLDQPKAHGEPRTYDGI